MAAQTGSKNELYTRIIIPAVNRAKKPSGKTKQLTPEEALQKLKHYCAYQERCHREVREKLFSLGMKKSEREQILAALIEENYLNEERFAVAFAGGKWRIKRWGRIKIRYELRQKGISEYCIRKALRQIGETEYREVLQSLAEEKRESLKDVPPGIRAMKIAGYLTARGFEGNLVQEYTRAE